MTRSILVLVVIGIFFAEESFAGEISTRVELNQTGESARVSSPECQSGKTGMTAADLVLKMGAAAADAYTGYPVTSAVLEQLPAGNRDWLKGRMGIHAGKSSCRTICVVHNKAKKGNAIYETSFTETGGEPVGVLRSSMPNDLNRPDYGNFTGVVNASTARTKKGIAFCATGKNWSNNKDRWFTVKVTY